VSEWIVWMSSALLALALLVTMVVVRRERAHTATALAAARVEATGLRRRLEELERRLEPPADRSDAADADADAADAEGYLITDVVSGGSTSEEGAAPGRHAPPMNPPLFVDLVLRESVVRSAAFVHGVRRALAPETRHRIRFQMRQEVKRSRKQRRVDVRAAKRHLADSERAAMNEDAA